MRFSIWDYSQVEITKFNKSHPEYAIDPTDIFIFTWFKGFAGKKGSTVTNKKDQKKMWTKEIDGVTYYYIRYEAIINDFPILSYSNIKSIQRRFDKYVKAGIFDRKVIYAGKKGNFSYFAFTDLFWSFEYDNNNPEHKENYKQTKQAGEDNSVQTKQAGEDNSVQTKQVGEDNSVQTLLINSTTSLNNSTTNSSYTKAEEVFYKKINQLFGYNPYFSPDPLPEIIKSFDECQLPLQKLDKYLEWIYQKLKPKCKDADNFINYFYKSFTQMSYISRFKNYEKDNIKIICPVCGTEYSNKELNCPNPECNFQTAYGDDEDEIIYQKAQYILKKTDENRYREYENAINELDKKIPVSIRITNKEKNEEYIKKQREIEFQYLKISKTA